MTDATDPEVREELVATVRRFVAKEVAPVASEMEHADEYPDAIVEQMKDLGLFGITIPEAYGGLGLDLLTYIGVVEELAYGWMSLSGIVNTHTIAAHLIVSHGTEAQKQRWLPRLATGELRGCLSLSEADAGSDTRNIACRATRDGDEYVIDGTKFWVTNGERAGYRRENGHSINQPCIGALILEVRHHVLINGVVELQVFVARRAGRYVEDALFNRCTRSLGSARRGYSGRGSHRS
jgi:alkylation response protein AidB-like acyl-CoA dehydrogenase